ncbi:snaclec stejaggregin-A subunit alpha-like [Acanthaster planci]|uniref:Snaclec stejaggregin-A subunit alpha-like n=1 Tax=Acanthaster planci TaxID=133434 RepID=A0A8B7YHB3_ACAPL|nr:snaclec stejaggregin-A subunit alpha-like [Acanthaster planci]
MSSYHLMAWLLMLVSVFSAVAVCPSGWKSWNRSCYALYFERMNWMEASEFCEGRGSRLAVPNSQGENDFIWQMVSERVEAESVSRSGVWIGCRRESHYSSFECSGGPKEMSFTNWYPGFPDQSSPQCILFSKGADGKWKNNKCVSANGKCFVCKMPNAAGVHCLTADAYGRLVGDLPY